MDFSSGKKYLITTDEWFFAPDGQQYRAVFGTVSGIESDESILGFKARHSTNWYVKIGNMLIAGCRVHYAIMTDTISDQPPIRSMEHEGKISHAPEEQSRIYHADVGEQNV